jgi:hypothetical protein
MRVDTHLQEFHNQYIFSNEGKELRDRLGSLLSIYIDYREPNNIHKIDTKVLTRNICNNLGKPELYSDLIQVIEQPEALKVLLVFFLKGFSWIGELYTRFNISRKFFVDKSVNTLKKHLLLLKESGEDINFHYFEIIKKCNQEQFRQSLSQAQFLFVTPDLIKLGFELLEYYEYLIKSNLTIGKTLQSTIKSTLIFIQEFERIREEEETLFTRIHKTDNDLIYETETKRSIDFQAELKAVALEFKQEKLIEKQQQEQLSQKENTALALVNSELSIINENKSLAKISPEIEQFNKNKHATITHNGKQYTSSEYEQIEQQRRFEDQELENTPTIIGKPELCLEVPMMQNKPFISLYLTPKGLNNLDLSHEPKPEPKTEGDKADAFLDSLFMGVKQ